VVLMTAKQPAKEGKRAGRIVSWARPASTPRHGTGPIPASRAHSRRPARSIGDLDLIEANEAFAAQPARSKDLGWIPPRSTSMAARSRRSSGRRIRRACGDLLHEMQKRDAKKASHAVHAAGMGIACASPRLNYRKQDALSMMKDHSSNRTSFR